ncbi:MAG: TIGR04149 family rSAM-modified RiPP, partial [Bacteroidales bacterium]|nr:TIGR04149 family rSAM-modified RiPP [Bacteroidales bacterium]
MKALRKLKINEFAEMTNNEMKHVVGGSGTTSSSGDAASLCDGKSSTLKCYKE